MKEHFVNYNQALALKELGFDEPCIAFYSKQLLTFHTHGIDPHFIFKRNTELWGSPSAPLKSQVFKWFRDEHSLATRIDDFYTDGKLRFDYSVRVIGSQEDDPQGIFISHEEAESECIDKLISILKERKA